MKARFYFVLLFLLATSMLYAIPPKTIPLSSDLYEEMDTLYRLEGLPLPSASRPWSSQEAKRIFSAISPDTRHQLLYESIKHNVEKNPLKEASHDLSYLLSTNLTAETYIHTNKESFQTSSDWIYAYDQRKPLARFVMELAFSDAFYFSTSVDIGASSVTRKDDFADYTDIGALFKKEDKVSYQTMAKQYTDIIASNLLLPSTDRMLADWPQESQLSIGGIWWHLSTGRSRIQWGNGSSGNLIVGSHIANHNHLTASFYSELVKLQFLYLFLPDPLNSIDQRIFLGHRLEAQLRHNLRLTITENVMYKGQSLQLRYLDPTYIYHNLYDSKRLNAIASIELDLAICKGLSFHGQFAMDQFRLPNESDTEANAMGVMVHVAYSWMDHLGSWTAHVEYAQTDPVLYRRDGVDFLVARGMHNNWPPVLIDYLGYGFGSDSQVFQTKLTYHRPRLVTIEGSLLIHRQGELTYTAPHHHSSDDTKNNTGAPNVPGPAPSGDTISERLIIGLGADYTTSIEGLSLYSQAHWIGKRVYDRPSKSYDSYAYDLQLVVGIQKRF